MRVCSEEGGGSKREENMTEKFDCSKNKKNKGRLLNKHTHTHTNVIVSVLSFVFALSHRLTFASELKRFL